MGPDEIRALRGDLSRAAFAERLSVTQLSVYRWELPDGAPQARRPRGKVLARLRQYADAGAQGAAEPPAPSGAATAPGRAPAKELSEGDVRRLRHEGHSQTEAASLESGFDHLDNGDFAAAEASLLAALASGALQSRSARVLAATGLAQIQLIARLDARQAFTAITPLLGDVEGIDIAAAARLHAVSALIFAMPDEAVFDMGKVNAHAGRVRALTGRTDELRVLAAAAQVQALRFAAEGKRLISLAAEASRDLDLAHKPLGRALALEAGMLLADAQGVAVEAGTLYGQALQRARELGLCAVEARLLWRRAEQRLCDAASPDVIEGCVQRARAALERASAAVGAVQLGLLGCEIEVAIRRGRCGVARALVDDADAMARQRHLRASPHVLASLRCFALQGDHAALLRLAERMEAPGNASLVTLTSVNAGLARTLLEGLTGDLAASLSTAEQVVASLAPLGLSEPRLRMDVHAQHVAAAVRVGDRVQVDRALEAFDAALSRTPSAWHEALWNRYRAMSHLDGQSVLEAVALLDASLSTLARAGDQVQAALGRGTRAVAAMSLGEPDAEMRAAQSLEELDRLGVVRPGAASVPPEVLAGGQTDATSPVPVQEPLARLVVAAERVAVRGADHSILEHELVAVVADLLGVPACELAEREEGGARRSLVSLGDEPPLPHALPFSDRSRNLELCLPRAPDTRERAMLRILSLLGGLSFEVAALRGFASLAEKDDLSTEGTIDDGVMIAASAALRRLRQELKALSGSRSTVIITGESGTGKEVIARAVHTYSARAERGYVTFNCAAVPRELFEGQLFGYRRGAFTGAERDHPGVIRSASGGTLFLDEVGELPLDLQPKLLRFLENGEVFPLGAREPVEVDVRVVAATHRDLADLVERREFRADLYYRLHVVPVHVPPLRERPDDAVALARAFIARFTEAGEPPSLSDDALHALRTYPFPGNVRQLRNAVERAMAFSPRPKVLTAAHLRLSAGALASGG